jgi:hypothetical protein
VVHGVRDKKARLPAAVRSPLALARVEIVPLAIDLPATCDVTIVRVATGVAISLLAAPVRKPALVVRRAAKAFRVAIDRPAIEVAVEIGIVAVTSPFSRASSNVLPPSPRLKSPFPKPSRKGVPRCARSEICSNSLKRRKRRRMATTRNHSELESRSWLAMFDTQWLLLPDKRR